MGDPAATYRDLADLLATGRADLDALIAAAAWTREHSGAGQAARLVTLALDGAEARAPTE